MNTWGWTISMEGKIGKLPIACVLGRHTMWRGYWLFTCQISSDMKESTVSISHVYLFKCSNGWHIMFPTCAKCNCCFRLFVPPERTNVIKLVIRCSYFVYIKYTVYCYMKLRQGHTYFFTCQYFWLNCILRILYCLVKVIQCASEHICSIVRYCFRSFKQL